VAAFVQPAANLGAAFHKPPFTDSSVNLDGDHRLTAVACRPPLGLTLLYLGAS